MPRLLNFFNNSSSHLFTSMIHDKASSSPSLPNIKTSLQTTHLQWILRSTQWAFLPSINRRQKWMKNEESGKNRCRIWSMRWERLREIIHEQKRTTWMRCDFKRTFWKFMREMRWVMNNGERRKRKREEIIVRKIREHSTVVWKTHLRGFQ